MVTFDDDHKAPDQLTGDVTTTNTTEESSQVQAITGSSDNTELQTHLVNHQPNDSENPNTSESKHDEQSSGGEPPNSSSTSGSSDGKTTSEEDDAPVLGLRFSNVITDQQHSVNNIDENTDEDEGDLLGDNLE